MIKKYNKEIITIFTNKICKFLIIYYECSAKNLYEVIQRHYSKEVLLDQSCWIKIYETRDNIQAGYVFYF